MAEKKFFNKYPYTDFHELNLDWVVEKTQDVQEAVDELDGRVTALESSIDGINERLTDAESDIDTLEGKMSTAESDISSLKGRASALENAAIMDAGMLSGVNGVTAGSSNVTLAFDRKQYADGTISATSQDSAVIPAATNSAAGVMLPTEKSKLNAFSVDASGNATFTGKVSAVAPASGSDLATKDYVDSLAITGSASASYMADIVNTWELTNFTNTAHFEIEQLSYGLVKGLFLSGAGTLSSPISNEGTIFRGTILAANAPKNNYIYLDGFMMDENTQTKYKCELDITTIGTTTRATITNQSGETITSGAELSADFAQFTFIDARFA